MGRTGALNPRSTAPRHHGRQARPVRGGLTPVGAEKSALTGSERGFQGLRAAACSFSRILQPVTHPPGSVSRETRLQVNLARRSTPAAAARRSGGHLQELHFLRRGRCPPQLVLADLAHTRIFEAEAGEGTGDAEVVERKGHFIDMFPVWDTLSANKTGRCPKWPRPK